MWSSPCREPHLLGLSLLPFGWLQSQFFIPSVWNWTALVEFQIKKEKKKYIFPFISFSLMILFLENLGMLYFT